MKELKTFENELENLASLRIIEICDGLPDSHAA
jgi:hypothetical protein